MLAWIPAVGWLDGRHALPHRLLCGGWGDTRHSKGGVFREWGVRCNKINIEGYKGVGTRVCVSVCCAAVAGEEAARFHVLFIGVFEWF